MTDMTNARVFELIEAYGPEPAAWPEAERVAARELLQSAPDVFAEALEDARALDAALAALPEPRIPAGLAERIAASAPFTPAREPAGIFAKLRSMLMIGGSILPSASALASSAVGLIIGYGAFGAAQADEIDYAEEAIYAAFDGGYDFEIEDFN